MRDSWVWLLSLFTVATFIEASFWTQLNAFTPLYLPRLGVAPEDVPLWVGLTASVANAVGVPFLPLWGALADRYARQPVIVRSFVAYLVAGSVAMLAPTVWVFVAGRAVMAFALGNSGLMLTTLSERAPQGRVGLSFSIMNGAAPLGAFVGPLLGGPVVDRWGFPALLLIDVALMLAVVLGMTFGYRDDFKGTDRGPLLRMAADSLAIIARSPRLRTLFPALFVLFAGWMLAFAYVPLAITALYSGPEAATAVGAVFGAAGVATLVASPLMGALADRVGHWRVLSAGALASVALWPLPALAPDIVSFAIALALLNGVMSGVFSLSFSVLASSASSDVRGRVMSFAFLPANLGFTVGAAIGSVVTRAGVFAVFPTAAVLTALGVVALRIAERQPLPERA